MYEVTILDNDPELKGPAKAVKVKILSARQPQLPPSLPGLPTGMIVAPIEFEGLTAKPYPQEFMEGRWRVAWSFAARDVHAPSNRAASSNGSAVKGKDTPVTTA